MLACLLEYHHYCLVSEFARQRQQWLGPTNPFQYYQNVYVRPDLAWGTKFLTRMAVKDCDLADLRCLMGPSQISEPFSPDLIALMLKSVRLKLALTKTAWNLVETGILIQTRLGRELPEEAMFVG